MMMMMMMMMMMIMMMIMMHSHLALSTGNYNTSFHFCGVPRRVSHFVLYVDCTKCPLVSLHCEPQYSGASHDLNFLSTRLKLEYSMRIVIGTEIKTNK